MLPAQGHTWLDLAASLRIPPNLSLSDDHYRRSWSGAASGSHGGTGAGGLQLWSAMTYPRALNEAAS